tara:strand:- start:6243 stop:6596 length:354 start_codon:yes stop_codon:yes gene_type:complete
MGLTGGIVDVGNLYDCLRGIYENKADESILDKYNEVRRKVYLDLIDVISSANIRRLFALDPDRAVEQDEFFQMVKKAETDEDFSRQLQNVSFSCERCCVVFCLELLIEAIGRASHTA